MATSRDVPSDLWADVPNDLWVQVDHDPSADPGYRVGNRRSLPTRIGSFCLALGLLLLAFVAYQLWGTALYEHQAQGQLKAELEARLRDLPHAGGSSDAATVSGPAEAAAAASSAQAPPLGSPLGLLTIPRIGMTDAAVVEGVGEAQLQEGPGHYPGTALPGQAGNVGIAGHRTTYGAPFYDLDQLRPGDTITLQVPQGTFDYQVTGSTVVNPNDVSVISPKPLPMLTLTTCNPRYSASTRLAVVAILHDSHPASSTMSPAPPTTTTPPTVLTAHRGTATTTAVPADAGHGDPLLAVAWGIVALATYLLVRLAFRRLRPRQVRWLAAGVGVPVVIALLFVFFEHVSQAIPASF